jgi:L-lactate permease
MAFGLGVILTFVLSWVVSAVIIYFVTKFLGEKKGIGTAFLAALVGTVVYILASMFLGNGLIASVVGGIVWLIALGFLYQIGWLKAFLTAIIIWLVAFVIGYFLPTLMGPL